MKGLESRLRKKGPVLPYQAHSSFAFDQAPASHAWPRSPAVADCLR